MSKGTELATVSKIKGFSDLSAEVGKLVEEQKKSFVTAALSGVKIGELINEFAAREELRKEVDDYNAERQKRKLGGRPKVYHCVVAEKLVESGACLSKKWLEKCARAHTRVLELQTSGKHSELDMAEDFLPAAFMDEDGDEESDAKKRLAFKEYLERLKSGLTSISKQVGEVALKNKKNQEQLAAVVEDVLAKHGCKCSVVFKV